MDHDDQRAIYSDIPTATATLGILNRCLRIGQTDTVGGHEAIAKPMPIPYHMRSLLELMAESGYFLRRSGRATSGTPSQLLTDLELPDSKTLRKKLMNYRITTLSDLMIFQTTGNIWNDTLCTSFPTISPILPACPPGPRVYVLDNIVHPVAMMDRKDV